MAVHEMLLNVVASERVRVIVGPVLSLPISNRGNATFMVQHVASHYLEELADGTLHVASGHRDLEAKLELVLFQERDVAA